VRKGHIINSRPVSSSNKTFLLLSKNCGLVSSPNNYGFVSSPNNFNLVSLPNNGGLASLPQNPISLHNNNGSYTVLFSNNYNSYSLWMHSEKEKKIEFIMEAYKKKKKVERLISRT